MGWVPQEFWFYAWQQQEIDLFFRAYRAAIESIQPSIQCILQGLCFLGEVIGA